ncbi:Gp35 [Mycolicibacterium canariasense]|uniref:Gp35 n=1 Tax=Mycolicibacterium canariasense TaxID=228230 RepID=A0A100WIN1_MYCCR|nr:hypothetical protein [Mycolicibacterium canariasense]MCV7213147.1 hypothetical protein [Mycolicibacterium canariasense]ORU98498.1 hypothetical protein AWB94_28565 [Mycolicibacterium canariasense]GAS98891.1 Gp35 [Mycolicibacterium canariasense]
MAIEPPPGFTDLLGDAEDAPPLGEPVLFKLDGVGTLWARKPRPRSLAVLAAAYNDALDGAARNAYLTRFLTDHIDTTDYERLIADMAFGRAPEDTIDRLLAGLCTWGTARPYKAVLSLAVTAGAGWRTIRPQIAGDPMLMPSMHRVLDEVEKIVVQSMQSGDPEADQRAHNSYMHRLYAPDKPLKRGEMVKPSWWPSDGGAAANARAARALAKTAR